MQEMDMNIGALIYPPQRRGSLSSAVNIGRKRTQDVLLVILLILHILK